MTRIHGSPRSLHDLDSIRQHIARDSAVYAHLVVHRLIAACETLDDFPEIGRVVPEVGDILLHERIVRPALPDDAVR